MNRRWKSDDFPLATAAARGDRLLRRRHDPEETTAIPKKRLARMEDQDELVSSAFLARVTTKGFGRPGVTLASVWLDINRALDPVLGRRGMAALYDRSVQVAQIEHAWLAGLHERLPAESELDSLARVFDAREPDEAARVGAALLRSFCRLLASLVGPSLTERLLRPVLINLSNGRAEPDESS